MLIFPCMDNLSRQTPLTGTSCSPQWFWSSALQWLQMDSQELESAQNPELVLAPRNQTSCSQNRHEANPCRIFSKVVALSQYSPGYPAEQGNTVVFLIYPLTTHQLILQGEETSKQLLAQPRQGLNRSTHKLGGTVICVFPLALHLLSEIFRFTPIFQPLPLCSPLFCVSFSANTPANEVPGRNKGI